MNYNKDAHLGLGISTLHGEIRMWLTVLGETAWKDHIGFFVMGWALANSLLESS